MINYVINCTTAAAPCLKFGSFTDMKILSSISFLTMKMEFFKKNFNADHWRSLQACPCSQICNWSTWGLEIPAQLLKMQHYQISSGARCQSSTMPHMQCSPMQYATPCSMQPHAVRNPMHCTTPMQYATPCSAAPCSATPCNAVPMQCEPHAVQPMQCSPMQYVQPMYLWCCFI